MFRTTMFVAIVLDIQKEFTFGIGTARLSHRCVESSNSSGRNNVNACLCGAFREALRWTVYSMQATGHILLGSSWYMEQLLEEEEEEESPEEGLALHRESPMGRLQSFLLRRATY